MVEIYAQIPQEFKDMTELFMDLVLTIHDMKTQAELLNEFTNSCKTEEEREFVNFYINLRLEQMLNER